MSKSLKRFIFLIFLVALIGFLASPSFADVNTQATVLDSPAQLNGLFLGEVYSAVDNYHQITDLGICSNELNRSVSFLSLGEDLNTFSQFNSSLLFFSGWEILENGSLRYLSELNLVEVPMILEFNDSISGIHNVIVTLNNTGNYQFSALLKNGSNSTVYQETIFVIITKEDCSAIESYFNASINTSASLNLSLYNSLATILFQNNLEGILRVMYFDQPDIAEAPLNLTPVQRLKFVVGLETETNFVNMDFSFLLKSSLKNKFNPRYLVMYQKEGSSWNLLPIQQVSSSGQISFRVTSFQDVVIFYQPIVSSSSSFSGSNDTFEVCESNWICSSWSFCSDEKLQVRSCVDNSSCVNEESSPQTIRTCESSRVTLNEDKKTRDVLFDIYLDLFDELDFDNNELTFSTSLINFGTESKVNVSVTYSIKDSNDVLIYEDTEQVSVEVQLDYIKTIPIYNLKPGKYSLQLDLTYPGQLEPAQTSEEFEIPDENQILSKFMIFVLIAGLSILVLMTFYFAKYIHDKKRK